MIRSEVEGGIATNELVIGLIIKALTEGAKEIGKPGIQWILNYIQSTIPTRNLWQIVKRDELVIVASTSALIYTGEYNRPVTGVGQLRAIAYAAESLKKAYGALELKHVYLSMDPLPHWSENDLLLLGSPKTNTISRRFLSEIVNDQSAIQEGSTICWRKRNKTDSRWIRRGAKKFAGKIEGDEVVWDCGFIARVKSPLTSENRTVVLFSGSHTYGTMLAAKYFVEDMPQRFRFETLERNNVVALVSASIQDGYLSTKIKLEKHYTWSKK